MNVGRLLVRMVLLGVLLYCVYNLGESPVCAQGLVPSVKTASFELTADEFTPIDLYPYYNLTGIYYDGTTFTGGLDGANALSGTLFLTRPNWTHSVFTFGPAGENDIISATAQAILIPSGIYHSLGVLAMAVNGSQPNQQFTITYSDGSTTPFQQGISDWAFPQRYPGEANAISMPYRVTSAGKTDSSLTYHIYVYSFRIDSAKQVTSFTLPNNPNVKILAITLR